MKDFFNKFYHNKLLNLIFPTLVYCLQKELVDCRTVLDLGCGPSSPLQHCKNIKYSVGVEAFKPYLNASKKKKIHNKYLYRKIANLNFPARSFDAVILIEVLEHLPEKVGKEILKKAQVWARKKVVVSSPNGFVAQKAVDNNPWQKHLSSWDYRTMKSFGFNSRGLAGLKYLRQEVQSETMGDDIMSSIRYRPKKLWFIVASLSQFVTFRIPTLAFELFNVKKIGKN